MCGCLSRLSLCGPVMDWRPVQGVPASHPMTAGIGSRPPRDPTDGISGYRNGGMDGDRTFTVGWIALLKFNK